MKKFFIRLIGNVIGFLLADIVLAGVHFSNNWIIMLIAVFVFGFINTFIKPVVVLLSLPAIIFSLGFFYVLINGMMLLLVTVLVPGFGIDNVWWAVIMSLIISIVNWMMSLLFDDVSSKKKND